MLPAHGAGSTNGPAGTPGSVQKLALPRRPSLSAVRCRTALAAYPGTRRAASTSPVWPCSGRGLPCGPCHHGPGGLLHHPFTLTGTNPAVCFLWHCLADCSGWVLPTALPCGARTFLGAVSRDATVWPTHSRPESSRQRRMPRHPCRSVRCRMLHPSTRWQRHPLGRSGHAEPTRRSPYARPVLRAPAARGVACRGA